MDAHTTVNSTGQLFTLVIISQKLKLVYNFVRDNLVLSHFRPSRWEIAGRDVSDCLTYKTCTRLD